MKSHNVSVPRTVRICLLLSGLLLLPSGDASSQTPPLADTVRQTVTLRGEIRHRFELDRRVRADDDEKKFGDYHLLRSRAQVTYAPASDVEGVIQIQDSRFFGQENGAAGRGTLDANAPALDLHQAYVTVRNLFESGVDLQFGRQELSYGNERLIGSVGWSNTGRSFDGIRGRLAKEWGQLDLFASRLQGTLGADPSQNFYGLYSRIDFNKDHAGDFFVLLDNNTAAILSGPDSGSAVLRRYTLGTFLRGTIAGISYEAEFARQAGETGDTIGVRSLEGMLLSGSLAWQSDLVKVGGLYTRLSGDGDPTDDRIETFNTLFATNHKFYGYMDYFPAGYQGSGLQDIALLTSWNLSNNASLSLDAHLFMTAADVGEENGLGKEIDATFRYKYNRAVSFTAGASIFIADGLMRNVVGGIDDDPGWWGYLMTTVTL